MILKSGEWVRVFAWTPTRILERNANGDYQLRTVFLRPMYATLVGGNGGAASIQYKTEATYAKEWFASISARLDSVMSDAERKAFLDQHGISYRTHTYKEAIVALDKIAKAYSVE